MANVTTPGKIRQVSVRSALWLGLAFIGLGLVCMIGPLVATFFVSGEKADPIYVNYSVFLLLGGFLLALGASIIVSLAVRIEAIGAGQFKLFGLDFPVEIQGMVFVFVMMLLSIGFTASYFDLTSLRDHRSELTKIRQDSKDLDKTTRLANEFRSIILDRLSGGSGQRMTIRVACGRHGPARPIAWNQGDGAGDLSAVLPTSGGSELPGAEPTNKVEIPRPMMQNTDFTYTILHTDPDGRTHEVLSSHFKFEDEVLVATIRSYDFSLSDACNPKIGSNAPAPEGGQAVQEAVRSTTASAEVSAEQ